MADKSANLGEAPNRKLTACAFAKDVPDLIFLRDAYGDEIFQPGTRYSRSRHCL